MHRRTFVVTASTATAIGLAGCIGGGSDGSSSPEGAVEALYNAESEDEVEDYFHPDSEFLNESDGNESEGNESENSGPDTELESTEVIAEGEDIDGSYLEDEGYILGTMSKEDVNSIAADEELAIVEATTEQSGNESPGTGGGSGTYLTATDGGNWYVLDLIVQMNTGPVSQG